MFKLCSKWHNSHWEDCAFKMYSLSLPPICINASEDICISASHQIFCPIICSLESKASFTLYLRLDTCSLIYYVYIWWMAHIALGDMEWFGQCKYAFHWGEWSLVSLSCFPPHRTHSASVQWYNSTHTVLESSDRITQCVICASRRHQNIKIHFRPMWILPRMLYFSDMEEIMWRNSIRKR